MHLLQSATPPPDVEISKYYYKKHVDDITQELNDALSLGSAAAEEWLKGLDAKGKERMKAAENWERWEIRDQEERKRPTSAGSMLAAAPQEMSKSSPRQIPSPVIHTPVPVGKYHSDSSLAGHVEALGNPLQHSLRPNPNKCSSLFTVCSPAATYRSTAGLYSAARTERKHSTVAPEKSSRCKRSQGESEIRYRKPLPAVKSSHPAKHLATHGFL